MKMSFIKRHIISKIEEQIRKKTELLKHDGFYYFDEPIINGKKTIDRVNKWNPYTKEDTYCTSWYSITGVGLINIYKQLKGNKIYIFKEIDKKLYKTRLKRDAE